MLGWAANSFLRSVDLPVPEGPEMTMGALGTIVRLVPILFFLLPAPRECTWSHFLLNGDCNWELEPWRGRVLYGSVYQFKELRSAGCGAAQAQHIISEFDLLYLLYPQGSFFLVGGLSLSRGAAEDFITAGHSP